MFICRDVRIVSFPDIFFFDRPTSCVSTPRWIVVYGKELTSVNFPDDAVFRELSEKHGSSQPKAFPKARPIAEGGEISDASSSAGSMGSEESDPYRSGDSVEGVNALRSVADVNYPQAKITGGERIAAIMEGVAVLTIGDILHIWPL